MDKEAISTQIHYLTRLLRAEEAMVAANLSRLERVEATLAVSQEHGYSDQGVLKAQMQLIQDNLQRQMGDVVDFEKQILYLTQQLESSA